MKPGSLHCGFPFEDSAGGAGERLVSIRALTMTGEIKNQQGERIDYTFHAGNKFPKAAVVIGHGVTGNKDRPFILTLAGALAQAGINTLRISFSGNGASGGRF